MEGEVVFRFGRALGRGRGGEGVRRDCVGERAVAITVSTMERVG